MPKNMAKKIKRPKGVPANAVHIPGFPPNQWHLPQAAEQYYANQRGAAPTNPALQQMQPQQINPYYNSGAPFGLQNPQQGQFQPQPQFQQQGIPMPVPTSQNTQIPGEVSLDPSRNQPADKTQWWHYLAGPFIGAAFPNTEAGRKWNDVLWGEPPSTSGASRFTDYQQNVLNYLTQGGLQGLSQTPPNFAPIANQQLERFYTNTIPSIAERFTAMGGGQRSSAFQGALANAGRFLGNDLAATQGQYNLQQQGNLLNMLNLGLTPQFENVLREGGQGLLQGAAKGATKLGQAYATGGLS